MTRRKHSRPARDIAPVHPHAAAVDIGATLHVAAVRPGCDPEPVRTFGTFTTDLHRLADWFEQCGVETVAMESTGVYWVDSSGRGNTAYVSCSEELVQSLGRCSPAQGLSRPAVEGDRHGCQVLGAVHAEVGALWKVLAQQPVGVLVRAALPRAVGIAEVDRHASLDPELGVLGHFRSLIPGQRSSQLFG